VCVARTLDQRANSAELEAARSPAPSSYLVSPSLTSPPQAPVRLGWATYGCCWDDPLNPPSFSAPKMIP
jgi:hypothetical protein